MKGNIKILLSLLIGISLVLILRLVFFSGDHSIVSQKDFWMNKTFASSSYDILVAGDSRVYRGVSVAAMKNASDQPHEILNLGYSSAGFSKEYFDFVLSKFENKSNSKILFLGITPHSLTKKAFENEHLHESINITSEEVFKRKYLSKIYKLFAPVKMSALITKAKRKRVNYIQEYTSEGWVASDKVIRNENEALKSYHRTFSKYGVEDKEIQLFLDGVLSVLEQGITVVVFRPPTSVALRQLEDKMSGFDETSLKKELLEMGVKWIDFECSNFKTYDGSHLTKESALNLSTQLGNVLNEIL